MEPVPRVVRLDDRRATDPGRTGAKAAALATATARGLPVLPGFVLTTAATVPGCHVDLGSEVQAAWRELSDDGQRPLVVRSSSTVEDLAGSSMAGRYESVIGVDGWKGFGDAVRTVVASRAQAADGTPELTGDEPLAVLVQPLLDATAGGVLFGVDPVSGRTDLVEAPDLRVDPQALRPRSNAKHRQPSARTCKGVYHLDAMATRDLAGGVSCSREAR
jgi:phosphoenolpyruvate synthase/pyruvate phosphate dikinase